MNSPKSPKIAIVIPAFRWHSQNFLQLIDGITDEDALKRVEGNTNHIVWMAGNFLDMRFSLAKALGIAIENPYNDLFFQGKTLDESFKYPTLTDLKESFHTISPLLYQKLLDLSDEELDKDFPMGMDVEFSPENVLNFLGMCIGREDYLCGQIGLMRKVFGYEGLKYEYDLNMKY